MLILLSTLLPLQTDSYAAAEGVMVNLAPSSFDCGNPSLLIFPLLYSKVLFILLFVQKGMLY